jgi:hypothetical protein
MPAFGPIATGFDGAKDSFSSQNANADKFQPIAVYKFLKKAYIRLVIKRAGNSSLLLTTPTLSSLFLGNSKYSP